MLNNMETELPILYRDEIKTIADNLVKTLGSMDAKDADRIVKRMAEKLYTDVLGLDGRIVCTKEYFIDYTFQDMNGDKRSGHYAKYEFKEDKQ